MAGNCTERNTSDAFFGIGLAFVGAGVASVPGLLPAGIALLAVAILARLQRGDGA